jgi:hypothetical protein
MRILSQGFGDDENCRRNLAFAQLWQGIVDNIFETIVKSDYGMVDALGERFRSVGTDWQRVAQQRVQLACEPRAMLGPNRMVVEDNAGTPGNPAQQTGCASLDARNRVSNDADGEDREPSHD